MAQNTKFAREFQRLNKNQREAVEHIEGPVMVVAGPGTGKTQVVAMRIAQILTKTQMGPRNILALTFTEAGVTALRKRLESIIGPDAYQVTISTFHGFANEVVATFPYVFGFMVEATQVTDLERLQIVHRIIERSTTLEALRPVRSPTFHVPSVAEAIRKCKQEDVSPERLREVSQLEYEEKISNKLTAVQRQAAERQLQLNTELSQVYEKYQQELKKRNLYDYEDMILFAIRGLRQEPDVRSYYQERYQYFLVDEYQDTNNAQNALVEALADFFPNPNLFVVGDDKQAIYRFQGASVANMLHFARKYPNLRVISLEENYRNAPQIVEAATASIAHNEHQLSSYLPGLQSTLSPTRDGAACELKIAQLPTQEAQFAWICNLIKERQSDGVPATEIAVLFRQNNEVREFREFALKSGINVAGVETSNLISEPEIQQLLLVLAAINDPTDPIILSPALRLIAPLSAVTLARLARAIETHKDFDLALESLKLEEAESLIITSAMQQITDWSGQQYSLGIVELTQKVICDSLILSEVSARSNALDRLEVLKAFLGEVRRFHIQRPGAGLGELLDYISLLRSYRVRLPIHRLSPTVDGVFVSTAHGAKGLEFDTVFLPNSSSNVWNDRARRDLIKLPAAIVGLTAWNESALEDERRLFYVAVTRAKNCIFVSFPESNAEGRELMMSQFISEIESCFKKESVLLDQEAAKKILTTSLQTIPPVVLRGQERAVVRELIQDNPFSFTDYKTYKQCPKQYLLNCVLRFPVRTDARLLYGSILHRALELFYKQYRSRKTLPSREALLKYLEQAASQTESFAGKDNVIAGAKRLLSAYYDHIQDRAVVPVGVEHNFRRDHVLLEDIWLTGKFDRIDPIDPVARTVKIVDYKTGSQAQTRNQIEGRTKSSDGILKEQLVFYALLAREDRHFPYHATEFALKFLDDKHTFREESFKITSDEIDELAKDVATTYREILSLEVFEHTREDFDNGCEICRTFIDLV